ncbi:C-type lectin domain family 4 member E-like isoform X1 [Micropterus salmoides]|uniref:C-type lectin domain family 4 member E-like isoform X1 n=1 Tax=Micropterus salmoides TaxID=27706 RepID=UPI0018EB7F55|nr:C-type lectin domain family 4 member E-like isoform X1 [Micropterus salmoides]
MEHSIHLEYLPAHPQYTSGKPQVRSSSQMVSMAPLLGLTCAAHVYVSLSDFAGCLAGGNKLTGLLSTISSIQPKTVLGGRKMSCLVELQMGIFTALEAPQGTSTNAGNSCSLSDKSCPAGWRIFLCSCYLLSSKTASWTEGRQDCRNRGADLVVIDSAEEQKFLSDLTTVQTSWIGLTDREMERSWKWIDGTPLTLSYWMAAQPDNGNGDPEWGEEDCAQLKPGENWKNNWNDLSCSTSLRWICEKEA